MLYDLQRALIPQNLLPKLILFGLFHANLYFQRSGVEATTTTTHTSRADFVVQHPNVARNKYTDQGPGTRIKDVSNEPDLYESSQAVDGKYNTTQRHCAQTSSSGSSGKWWLVDLIAPQQIHQVAILNTKAQANRLQNITVDVFEEDPRTGQDFPDALGSVCAQHAELVGASEWLVLPCSNASEPLIGRYVRVIKFGSNRLAVCEVEVYASLTSTQRTFHRTPDTVSVVKPQEALGVFNSPALCALRVLQSPHLNAFDFHLSTGSCNGYNTTSSGKGTSINKMWSSFVSG